MRNRLSTRTPRRLVLSALSAAVGLVVAVPLALAGPASAATTHATRHATIHASTHLSGATRVTTAPGIATALVKAGVLPLPVFPATRFAVGLRAGQPTASYVFPITGGDPDLAGPSGDITHRGGIDFVSRKAHLEIGRFDIDLAAGKVFATQVNWAPGKVAVLDLDLSHLSVSTSSSGATVLTGIAVRLDPAAAGALNATFGLDLPTDGSLLFGHATVTLK